MAKKKTLPDRDVAKLLKLLSNIGPYPPGVVPVTQHIPGTAFFPGGYGLWSGDQDNEVVSPFPFGRIMVLGHDFGSVESHRASFDRGHELDCATWRNMRSFFEEAGINLSECFFTNFYMGLRKGSKNTGKFPGATDPDFVDRCRAFLSKQIAFQKPRAILTLGTWVPSLLAPLSPNLSPWSKAKTFHAIDNAGGLIPNCRFDGVPTPIHVAALTHPSLRGSNINRRQFGSKTGNAAELALVKKALKTR
jgi:uracil-DNA glycosylase